MTQQRIFKPRPRKNRWQRAADAERLAEPEPEPRELTDPEPEPRELTDPGLATTTALLLAKIHETLDEL